MVIFVRTILVQKTFSESGVTLSEKMNLTFLLLIALFILAMKECDGTTASTKRFKLRHRKTQTVKRRDFLNEISFFRKQIEGPLREPPFVPYPIQSPKDSFNYSTLLSLSNLYLRSFLTVIAPPPDVYTMLNHLESPLLVTYYTWFEQDLRLVGFKRVAESRCLLRLRSRSRQNKCLVNVFSLYGPICAKKGQSLPWIVLRGLLIREGIYPDDGFRDLRSTCRSILSGFNKMRSIEIRATAESINVRSVKRTKKPNTQGKHRNRVLYDEAASFMLTFQEALVCFLRQANRNKRNADLLLYQSALMRFLANDLVQHLLDGEKQLTWQRCFPWVTSALEPKTSAHREMQTMMFIQTMIVFTFIVISGILFKAFVL